MDAALFDRLVWEYRRVCPDEETSGFTFVGLDPAEFLRELELVPDGAGTQAIVEILDRILTRHYGPQA